MSCDGRAVPVGPEQIRLTGYAVSSSRMVLAVVNVVNYEPYRWQGEAFSLKAPYPRIPWRVPSFNGIQVTCGTVTAWNGITIDALSGRPIGTAAWPYVLCDDSGTLRAEADAATSNGYADAALKIGKLRIWVPDIDNIAVSPRGKYLAWVGARYSWPVCVEQLRENAFAECGRLLQPYQQIMGISVTDDGAVITSAQNIELTCDLCRTVYWWQPGMAEPVVLQTAAKRPQWVSRDAAQGLIARYRYLRKQQRGHARPQHRPNAAGHAH